MWQDFFLTVVIVFLYATCTLGFIGGIVWFLYFDRALNNDLYARRDSIKKMRKGWEDGHNR